MDGELMRPVDEATTPAVYAPLVTVMIVNYNYAAFIAQCIRSVDQQDYPNIQCIVVDCASNDDSVAVIEATLKTTRNSFFQLLRRDVNQGQVLNSLAVLSEAKGVFLTYLDADDFIFPDFVSTHVKAHLNDLNSAALSITDQIQVDAGGQVLAGTCHWHQKWRASEAGTPWVELTSARSWVAGSPNRLEPAAIGRLHYIPAWWSSWLRERWIWSTTSAIMFRRSVIEAVAPDMAPAAELRDIGIDGLFARFAHSIGGTLVIDGGHGAYRRHGKNIWSSNQVLGGQTPNGVRDEAGRFRNLQRVATMVLTAKYADLVHRLGPELYYSIAWQVMSHKQFFDFARAHKAYRTIWEKTIEVARTAGR